MHILPQQLSALVLVVLETDFCHSEISFLLAIFHLLLFTHHFLFNLVLLECTLLAFLGLEKHQILFFLFMLEPALLVIQAFPQNFIPALLLLLLLEYLIDYLAADKTLSFFFSSSAWLQILQRLQFLRKDYLIIYIMRKNINQVRLYKIQRMYKMPTQKSAIFANLEMFKGSYKVMPPQETSWGALGNQLKIEQNASVQPSIDQHTWSEQVSSNPFVKTKQLFRNKNVEGSVLEDDLTNQFIFTAAKEEGPEERNFQFDSFGVHNNPHKQQMKLQELYPSNASSQEIKAWNSSSLQINFEKVRKDELNLPDPLEKSKSNNYLLYSKTEQNDSSIKEFCFRLNDTCQLSLEKTPIKKWSELKQSKPASMIKEGDQKKQTIKKIVTEFIERLDYIPEEKLTEEFIKDTKVWLEQVGRKQRTPLRDRINESLETSKRKTKHTDDQSSTMRLYTEQSRNADKTERREMTEYKINGKFKVYQCNSKKKATKTPIKSDKKTTEPKNKKFRF